MKYNFETLQRTTKIKSLKMIVPQKLELTAVNESILMDHVDVFEKNGFQFSIDPEAEVTKKVLLTHLPLSKNWIFGPEDIQELIFCSEMVCKLAKNTVFCQLRLNLGAGVAEM